MDKDRILTLARQPNDYVVTQNTHEDTLKRIANMCHAQELRVTERFQCGQGCRVVAM